MHHVPHGMQVLWQNARYRQRYSAVHTLRHSDQAIRVPQVWFLVSAYRRVQEALLLNVSLNIGARNPEHSSSDGPIQHEGLDGHDLVGACPPRMVGDAGVVMCPLKFSRTARFFPRQSDPAGLSEELSRAKEEAHRKVLESGIKHNSRGEVARFKGVLDGYVLMYAGEEAGWQSGLNGSGKGCTMSRCTVH